MTETKPKVPSLKEGDVIRIHTNDEVWEFVIRNAYEFADWSGGNDRYGAWTLDVDGKARRVK